MQARKQGFTLAELLIALALLGVLATFTIPKVLQAQTDKKFNSIAMEAAATISAAYDAYRLENQPTADFGIQELLPYLNYVRMDTSLEVDEPAPWTTHGCPGTAEDYTCLVLHNGAILSYFTNETFSGTSTLNAVQFQVDPDGVVSGNSDSVEMLLYYNQRITSRANTLSSTQSSHFTYNPDPAHDPDWLAW